MPSPLLPQARRLIAAACLLFLVSGAWFGLVAARSSHPTWADGVTAVRDSVFDRLKATQQERDSLKAARESAYRDARRADRASAYYADRMIRAEGERDQCRANW